MGLHEGITRNLVISVGVKCVPPNLAIDERVTMAGSQPYHHVINAGFGATSHDFLLPRAIGKNHFPCVISFPINFIIIRSGGPIDDA